MHKQSRFVVYIQSPCGRKTRGTCFKRGGKQLMKRINFLRTMVTANHAVITYDILKRRVVDVACGMRKPDQASFITLGWIKWSEMRPT